MKRLAMLMALAALVAPASLLSPLAARAEPVTPRVTVPVVPPGPPTTGFVGAWKLQGLLYDRFGLNVWLDRYGGGEYTARVGWERCSGDLDWRQLPGNRVLVNLSRSRCDGPSGTWSADRMICEPVSGIFPHIARPWVVNPRVVDPGPGIGAKLACTYLPGSGYYGPTRISLKRT